MLLTSAAINYASFYYRENQLTHRGPVKKRASTRKARLDDMLARVESISKAKRAALIKSRRAKNAFNQTTIVDVAPATSKRTASFSPVGKPSLKKAKIESVPTTEEKPNSIQPLPNAKRIASFSPVGKPAQKKTKIDPVSIQTIVDAVEVSFQFYAGVKHSASWSPRGASAKKKMRSNSKVEFNPAKITKAINEMRSDSIMEEAREFSEMIHRKKPLIPITEELPVPQAVDEVVDDVAYEGDDEPIDFGADNDFVEEPLVAEEPAVNVGQALFAGIVDTFDEVVSAPTSRILKEIESSLDGAYWAPVVSGKRTRRAPVRL